MNFYELKIMVKLSMDMNFVDVPYNIGVFINNSMLKTALLKKFHEEKFYKYVFDTFYPIERDKVYKKDKIYSFRLRSMNIQLLNKMAIAIYNHNYNNIKAIDVDLKMEEVDKINEIYTLKPVIVTIDSKPWLKEKYSVDLLVKRLNDNLEKKLNQIGEECGVMASGTFISEIEILNKFPMKYSYKSINLLGNKVQIKVNQDEFSQKKALAAIALGLGEKGSSLGAGFCDYK
ncbi:CRISPR-associated endoribonuclease Cas6 [Clostridiaceae bacterium UIB06]|uniref:CRISPR-associated endoribonuclease Cas6 n=1 Tax=Clostridium thailandense TaxID=2794346 RepID=A0A949TMJ5_9CLOT|nr:CRISPR-associated endoribonuclease Cas6 [Clostridium thailandense]MBV7275130.1 CRISPR-associated endoribonuclease Cas6 [Clostridium thailandense]MCH5136913.1 CRISPR-associated endoribonuclease Cas6 [Clostridiaceae bacterium UIB06]